MQSYKLGQERNKNTNNSSRAPKNSNRERAFKMKLDIFSKSSGTYMYWHLFFHPQEQSPPSCQGHIVPHRLWHSYPEEREAHSATYCRGRQTHLWRTSLHPKIRSHHLKTALEQRHLDPSLQVPCGQRQELLPQQHNGKARILQDFRQPNPSRSYW